MKSFFRKSLIALLVVAMLFSFPGLSLALDWTEVQPIGNTDQQWTSFDGDADGSNLIAAVFGGRLYTSSDGGANWTERQPAGDMDINWNSVASDDDGSNLIVGMSSGRLYTSSDGGANWTERQPEGDVNKTWYVASDSTGLNLVAAVGSNGRLYTSSDGGANWTERQPEGAVNKNWRALAIDDDGTHLVVAYAATTGARRMYTSSDGGANWTERKPSGADHFANWTFAKSDADGSVIFVGADNSRVYVSTNGGVSWSEKAPTGLASNYQWRSAAIDEDGSTMITGVYGGRLYVSYDTGNSWMEEQPAGASNKSWNGFSVSDDGQLFAAAVYFGRVYIGADETDPTIDTLSPADDATDIAIDTNLVITFDEDIATSTAEAYITLYDASDDSTIEAIDVTSNQVTIDGAELTINPSSDLTPGEGYYVLIDATAIEDLAGNPFAGIADETTWSFTTIPPDETAPTTLSFDPADDATGVAVDYFINSGATIEFDETVVAGTGSVTIYDASDDSVVAVYDVEDENYVYIEGEYAYIYTEEEAVLLERGKTYYILIDEGAFEDVSGNPFAGIADETTWNFTTKPNPTVIIDEAFVTGDGFDSTVRALMIQTDGKIIAGGDFSSYDDTTTNYIARLNTDGSIDETFVTGDGFDTTVSTMEIDADGKIVVGGYFTSYDGATSTYIARLNTDGSLDEAFTTGDGFNGNVVDIAVQDDGKIVVVGWFDGYDGESTGYGIVRLNTDGSLDETFVTGDGFNDSPLSVYIQDDGKILVGGYFNGYGVDLLGFGLARLNTDGSLDDTFVTGDGFGDGVSAITIQDDGKILVGGDFSSYDGTTTNYIARLNTDGSLDGTFTAGLNSSVYTIRVDEDGKILVGGEFDSYGTSFGDDDDDDSVDIGYGIARLNTDGSLDEAFTTGDGFDSSVYTMEIDADGKIVVGGDFGSYDGTTTNYIVRLIPPGDEEEEEEIEEEEETPSSGGRSSSSHRRSSSFPSTTLPTGAPAVSVEVLMQQLIVLLQQLLEQLIAEQQGNQ